MGGNVDNFLFPILHWAQPIVHCVSLQHIYNFVIFTQPNEILNIYAGMYYVVLFCELNDDWCWLMLVGADDTPNTSSDSESPTRWETEMQYGFQKKY